MRLLFLLTWPYVRKHLLRSLLTTVGIVLGVAVFVGMHTANQSVLKGFEHTVDRIAGATQLQVSAGDTGFDESVLEKVQSVQGVRVAVPVIEAVVDSGIPGQGNLLILGVDMLGDRSLRDYDLENGDEDVMEDPLVFLAQPDSLIVTRPFAQATGLKVNSKLKMRTMDGEKQFTVRGIMKAGGLSSAFGGNLAVMDVYSAQKIFGRGRRFDQIDMAVNEGVSVEDVKRRIQALLGSGYEVEPPSARGQHFEEMARNFSISINFSSIFALLIGMFIIYNSFAIAVTQRRSEIGIVRALGATQTQIRSLFLVEGAIAGVFGSIVGVLFGILLARGIAAYVSGLLGRVYGVAQKAEELSTQPKLLAGAMLIGIVTSIIAAWIPARNAARVDPVRALQKGRYQVLSAGENRLRAILAIVCALIAALSLFFAQVPIVFYTGYVLLIVAALLLAPAMALWLARMLRPVMRWIRPVEGALAADSLIQSPRRTSATVAALMLSLALAIGFAGIARSSFSSIVEWVDSALNPDLFVSTSDTFTSRSFRFSPELKTGLQQVEGIDEVQMVRSPRVLYGGTPIMLVAAEVESLARRVHRKPIAGDERTMYQLAAAGMGVIASDNLAIMRKLKLGDMIEIPAPNGVMRLPIVGIVIDFSDQQGSILIDRSVYVKYWKDESVNVFRVYLKPGASEADVKRRILEKFSAEQRLFVFTNSQLRAFILDITNQWFGLTYIQLGVAVLVAILGIVNTLTVSITDRRRELGVLQAVGGLRRQIRHTIWMEASAIGVIGLILGLGFGALNLYYSLTLVRQHVGGIRLHYEYPIEIAGVLIPVILAAAFLSALGPAESAVRGSLVEALEYE
jgi:putative ABC transport system permease protein